MGHGLSGSIARISLLALKEASGPQYEKILEESGLARYKETLPAEGRDLAISDVEMAHFQQAAYRMLGEDLLRLFHRNLGQRVGMGLVQSAWGQQMRAQAAGIPVAHRRAWFVTEYVTLAASGWAHYGVTEDTTAWYLESAQCMECSGLQGAKAPLCSTTDMSLRTVAEGILGQRLRVQELACRAMGAPACKHAVYK